MESGGDKVFIYDFKVGMTCDGCSNAIKKLLSTETYVQSYELSVPDKKLLVRGPDGIEEQIMTRLGKWATAAKKELEFVGKSEAPLQA
jgi:copper chaperone CopZ